jgi:hypothetical protein
VNERRFEGVHCSITVRWPAPGVAVVVFVGRDVGELGDAPFVELERQLTQRAPIELFIDARGAKGASVDVSGSWAAWLRAHKGQLTRVHMVTGSRFIELSADMVRRFAELGDIMRVTTDPAAFDDELAARLPN